MRRQAPAAGPGATLRRVCGPTTGRPTRRLLIVGALGILLAVGGTAAGQLIDPHLEQDPELVQITADLSVRAERTAHVHGLAVPVPAGWTTTRLTGPERGHLTLMSADRSQSVDVVVSPEGLPGQAAAGLAASTSGATVHPVRWDAFEDAYSARLDTQRSVLIATHAGRLVEVHASAPALDGSEAWQIAASARPSG